MSAFIPPPSAIAGIKPPVRERSRRVEPRWRVRLRNGARMRRRFIRPRSSAAGVELGGGVEIGPFCVLEGRIRIGARTRLGAHLTIFGAVGRKRGRSSLDEASDENVL